MLPRHFTPRQDSANHMTTPNQTRWGGMFGLLHREPSITGNMDPRWTTELGQETDQIEKYRYVLQRIFIGKNWINFHKYNFIHTDFLI